ncbi:MAG TPA: phosphatidylserine decarboxylase [Gammaproteobacteria bacterium]|nr:phosphatidylserine decarboxylase [Gammaproteobacteria bacterium]
MQKSLKVLLHQYIIPCGLLSRITYFLMHARHFPFRDRFISFMIRRHRINLDEVLEPDYTDRKLHPDINSFFVRALKPAARPIAEGENVICSPVDGTISQIGNIVDTRIFQAKGHSFSLVDLLGGSGERAGPFRDGQFATIYLSPSDYHRVHMPVAGRLSEMVHIPGKLLSVAPFLIDAVPDLFARNERVASIFATDTGQVAVIMIGAINVGSIETVWAGEITPPQGLKVTSKLYPDKDAINLEKGEEMGRFNMGSTVIILFEKDRIDWTNNLHCNDKIKMGQPIGMARQ